LDSYFEEGPSDCVVINNEQGAYLATRHLIDMGHSALGYLHSSIDINNFSERHNGFLRAVSSYPQTEGCVDNVIPVRPTIDGAYVDMRAYIQSKNFVPEALFADNDIIATSCMRALIDEGYSLPEDVSVVGFDNMPISEMFQPPLTTVHVPKQRLGVLAVDRLIKIINGETEEHVKISLATSLIERKSVRDMRSHSGE
jgi:LacI family transcriptional regulator